MKPSDSPDDDGDMFGFAEEELAKQSKPAKSEGLIAGHRRYKPKSDRQQTDCFGFQLEDFIPEDSIVRAIDIYVVSLDLVSLGFKNSGAKLSAGQPPYDPASLLRLYLYGYQCHVRSSRRLARECRLNVELMWLMQGQAPQYRTINNFRSENSKALKQAHSDFQLLCWEAGLIGGERISIDGSHFRGNASAKSFKGKESLEKMLETARDLAERWQQSLDEQEAVEEGYTEEEQVVDPELLKTLLDRAKQREGNVVERLKQLEASGEKKQSYTDPDARLLNKRGNKTQGYNVQIAVDHSNYLIIGDAVTNDVNDLQQLHPIAIAVKKSLKLEKLEVVADKGYYAAKGIVDCLAQGITPYVAIPSPRTLKDGHRRYTRDQFKYDSELNAIVCPAGKLLKPAGKPVTQPGQTASQRFRSKGACAHCEQSQHCLTDKGKYRDFWRMLDQPVLDAHAIRMKENEAIYNERQAAVEHPFGTLKARAGWSHFLVRGMEKVQGEWSLMALCYNFTRVVNLLGCEKFAQLCRERAANRQVALKPRKRGAIAALMRRLDGRKNRIVMQGVKKGASISFHRRHYSRADSQNGPELFCS